MTLSENYFRQIPDFVFYIVVYITLTDCQQSFYSYYTKFINNQLIVARSISTSTNTNTNTNANANTNTNINSSIDDTIYGMTDMHYNYVNLEHIIENRNIIHDKYIDVYNQTRYLSNRVSVCVVIVSVFAIFCVWYSITLLLLALNAAKSGEAREASLHGLWAAYYVVVSGGALVTVVFMIYPTLLWSDKYEEMKKQVSDCIDLLIVRRTEFNCEKSRTNTGELANTNSDACGMNSSFITTNSVNIGKLSLYSQESIALECLNRFYRIINEKPCVYMIFGFAINKTSLKVLVAGFIVGKIVSLMWNTINLD